MVCDTKETEGTLSADKRCEGLEDGSTGSGFRKFSISLGRQCAFFPRIPQ